ncbi:MAG: hypothetical protein ACOCR0_03285 [Haloferacaceae archaeon]
MYLSTLYILVAIAGISTVSWAVLDRQPRVMTAVSAGVWAMIAFQGGEISTHHPATAETVTHSAPMLQYVAAFFAALSLFAMISFSQGWVPEPREHRRSDPMESNE